MEDELYRIVRLHVEQILAILDSREEGENKSKSKPIDGVISAIGLRWILLTWSVGTAWHRFSSEKQKKCIIKTFRRYFNYGPL